MRILVPPQFLPPGLPERPVDKQQCSFCVADASTNFEYDAALGRWFKIKDTSHEQ